MRLNRASDFAMRILILLCKKGEVVSVDLIAERLALPKSHVMKIVARLASANFISTQRGPGGGVELHKPATEIRIGDVVRAIEREFAVVDCLGSAGPRCVFEPRCALMPVMSEATDAFLRVLDGYYLSDVAPATQQPRRVAV